MRGYININFPCRDGMDRSASIMLGNIYGWRTVDARDDEWAAPSGTRAVLFLRDSMFVGGISKGVIFVYETVEEIAAMVDEAIQGCEVLAPVGETERMMELD